MTQDKLSPKYSGRFTRGIHANIPRKKNAKTSNRHMDWLIYQARHVVENTFASLKHRRAITSRYDKLLNSYIGQFH